MRRKSRELALQILFQTEFAPQIRVQDLLEVFEEAVDKETLSYAEALVDGVLQHKAEIDAKIQSASRHWKMERMASVDRNVLRLAVFELKFAEPLQSPQVAINEAIEIAKQYGTTDSGAFVNGVLDPIAKGL